MEYQINSLEQFTPAMLNSPEVRSAEPLGIIARGILFTPHNHHFDMTVGEAIHCHEIAGRKVVEVAGGYVASESEELYKFRFLISFADSDDRRHCVMGGATSDSVAQLADYFGVEPYPSRAEFEASAKLRRIQGVENVIQEVL